MEAGGFRGTVPLSLDNKGRVTVPVCYRDDLAAISGGRVFITKHRDRCLQILPEPAWAQFSAKVLQLPAEDDSWRRFFIGSVAEAELDSGGRLMVPPALRDFAKLKKDVLMVGMGQRLELWDSEVAALKEQDLLDKPMPAQLGGLSF